MVLSYQKIEKNGLKCIKSHISHISKHKKQDQKLYSKWIQVKLKYYPKPDLLNKKRPASQQNAGLKKKQTNYLPIMLPWTNTSSNIL